MNLPEYREAIQAARLRFHKDIVEAGEALQKALAVADREFFEQQPMPAEREEFYDRAAEKLR